MKFTVLMFADKKISVIYNDIFTIIYLLFFFTTKIYFYFESVNLDSRNIRDDE